MAKERVLKRGIFYPFIIPIVLFTSHTLTEHSLFAKHTLVSEYKVMRNRVNSLTELKVLTTIVA